MKLICIRNKYYNYIFETVEHLYFLKTDASTSHYLIVGYCRENNMTNSKQFTVRMTCPVLNYKKKP